MNKSHRKKRQKKRIRNLVLLLVSAAVALFFWKVLHPYEQTSGLEYLQARDDTDSAVTLQTIRDSRKENALSQLEETGAAAFFYDALS